jgi:ribosomal protein S18 acetylase RimI-like enzyme
MASDRALLAAIEAGYDAIPRPRADLETVGPFTLFVAHADRGFGYYARPRVDGAFVPTVEDARRLLTRQRELDVPPTIEWVDEIVPTLDRVAVEAGYDVRRYPLMALDVDVLGSTRRARLVEPDEEELLVETRAAISVAFEHDGTARGDAGTQARDRARESRHAVLSDGLRADLRAGHFLVAAAFPAADSSAGSVGGGTLMPTEQAAEIAGVGILPAYRRRGLAADVARVLCRESRRRGVEIVFCSADSDDVARVYARVGFRRVGTALIAAAP